MPDYDEWYEHFFLGRCFFGKFMSIAENGDVIPCSYNDAYRVGNLKSKQLGEVWEDMQNSEFFTKVKDKQTSKENAASASTVTSAEDAEARRCSTQATYSALTQDALIFL